RGQVLSHQGQGAINDADQGSVKPGRNLTGLNSRRGVDGALESVRIGHLEVRLNLSLSERPHNLLVTKVDEPAVQVGRVRPTLSAEHDRLSGDTVARNLRLVTRVRGNGRLARPTETRLAVRRERPLSQERDVLTPVRSRPVNLPEPRRRGGELTQAVAVVVVVVVDDVRQGRLNAVGLEALRNGLERLVRVQLGSLNLGVLGATSGRNVLVTHFLCLLFLHGLTRGVLVLGLI